MDSRTYYYAYSMELGARLLKAYYENDLDEITRLRNEDPAAAFESVLDVAALMLEEYHQGADAARDHVTAVALIASVGLDWSDE